MPTGTKDDPYLVVGYGRVSTDDQDTSIKNQRDLLKPGTVLRVKNYKNDDIWVRIIEYFEDDGVSGATTSRQGLDQAIDFIKSHSSNTCNGLIAKNSSRLFRNVIGMDQTIINFDRAGYYIFTIDNGEQTRMLQQDFGNRVSNSFTKLTNEAYVLQTKVNVNRSIISKFKKGQVVTGVACTGYTFDKPTGRFLPNDDAQYVREAYNMFNNNATYTEIAMYLQTNIPEHIYKDGSKKKASWSISAVKKLLGSFRNVGLLINGIRTVSTDFDGVKTRFIHPGFDDRVIALAKEQICTFYNLNYITTEEGKPQRVRFDDGEVKYIPETTELIIPSELRKAYVETTDDASGNHGIYPAWVYVPIVDPETFLKAYSRIESTEKRSDNARLVPVVSRILRGKVHCSCGCAYIRKMCGRGSKIVYWRPLDQEKPATCKAHQRVFEEDLEHGLMRAFNKLVELMSDDEIRQELLSEETELKTKNRQAHKKALIAEKAEITHTLSNIEKNLKLQTKNMSKLTSSLYEFESVLKELENVAAKAKSEKKQLQSRLKEIDITLIRLEEELKDKELSDVGSGMSDDEIRYYLLSHLQDVTIGHPLGMEINYKNIEEPDWTEKMIGPIPNKEIVTTYSEENCSIVDHKICSKHQGKTPHTNWVQFTIDGVPLLVFCRSEILGWKNAGRNVMAKEFERPIYINWEPFNEIFKTAMEELGESNIEEILKKLPIVKKKS